MKACESVLLSKLRPGLVCANRSMDKVTVDRRLKCGWFAVMDARGCEYYVDKSGFHRHDKRLDLIADFDLRMHVPSIVTTQSKKSNRKQAHKIWVED